MIIVFDFNGEGKRFASLYKGACYVTHREFPPGWFDRGGASADTYDAPVLLQLASGQKNTIFDGYARLQTFLNSPRSLVEVSTFLLQEGKRCNSTKPITLAHQLLVYKPVLGDMAYARNAVPLEKRFDLLIIDLSQLPLEFARTWFAIWVHRMFMQALLHGPQKHTLVILQGDTLFGKEFGGTTGSLEVPLSKRVLGLQRLGWNIILLSHQPSELDQVLRNAVNLPFSLAVKHKDAREVARLFGTDDECILQRLLTLLPHHALTHFRGLSHTAEVSFPSRFFGHETTPELHARMQPQWDWIRQQTRFSDQSSPPAPENHTQAKQRTEQTNAVTPLTQHYRALLHIIDEHPGIRTKELLKHTSIKPSTVYKYLSQLRTAGLLQQTDGQTTSKGGKPPQQFTLTEKGKELLHGRKNSPQS